VSVERLAEAFKEKSMKITVSTRYTCCPSDEIELEGVSDWSEIKEWYVKWHTFYYTLDGDDWLKVEMDSDFLECIDTKRPYSVSILDEEYGVIA
jgi:hypothetical protein